MMYQFLTTTAFSLVLGLGMIPAGIAAPQLVASTSSPAEEVKQQYQERCEAEPGSQFVMFGGGGYGCNKPGANDEFCPDANLCIPETYGEVVTLPPTTQPSPKPSDQ